MPKDEFVNQIIINKTDSKIREHLDRFKHFYNYKNSDISRLSNIPYTTIDGIYKKGEENIKLTTLKKLAMLLNCTLDELVGLNNTQEIDQTFLSELHKLNATGQKKVLDYMHDLTENPKYTEKEPSTPESI